MNDCPFCFASMVASDNILGGFKTKYVLCESCGAEGPMAYTEEDAIKLWNAPTDYIDGLRKDCERLRKELDECNGVIR